MCIDAEDKNSVTGVACNVVKVRLMRFESRTQEVKFDILREGRPTPALPSLTRVCKDRNRQYNRKFKHETTYKKVPWLTGCSKLKKLFCWPCLLFDYSGVSTWTDPGFSNLKYLTGSLKKHGVDSQTHKASVLKLEEYEKLREKFLNIGTCNNPNSAGSNEISKTQFKIKGGETYVSVGSNTTSEVVIFDAERYAIRDKEEPYTCNHCMPVMQIKHADVIDNKADTAYKDCDCIIQEILGKSKTDCITHGVTKRMIIIPTCKLGLLADTSVMKPKPVFSNLSTVVSKSKQFCRTSYTRYEWLTGCKTKQNFYCWPCLFFNPNKIELNSTGYNEKLELMMHLQIHNSLPDHYNALMIMKKFKEDKSVDITHILEMAKCCLKCKASGNKSVSQVEITIAQKGLIKDTANISVNFRTIHSSIRYLLKSNAQQNFWTKLAIRNLGCPNPTVSGLSNKVTKTLYDKFDWLTGCNKFASFYCWPCLFCSDRKSNPTKWNSKGFKDLENLEKCAIEHASSPDHVQAYENFLEYEKKKKKKKRTVKEKIHPPVVPKDTSNVHLNAHQDIQDNSISCIQAPLPQVTHGVDWVLIPENTNIAVDNSKLSDINHYAIDEEFVTQSGISFSEIETDPLELNSLLLSQESEINSTEDDSLVFQEESVVINPTELDASFLPKESITYQLTQKEKEDSSTKMELEENFIKTDIDIDEDMIGNDIITYNKNMPAINQDCNDSNIMLSESNFGITPSPHFNLVISNDIELAKLSYLNTNPNEKVTKEITVPNMDNIKKNIPSNSQINECTNLQKTLIKTENDIEVPFKKFKKETEVISEVEGNNELESNKMYEDQTERFQEVYIQESLFDEPKIDINDETLKDKSIPSSSQSIEKNGCNSDECEDNKITIIDNPLQEYSTTSVDPSTLDCIGLKREYCFLKDDKYSYLQLDNTVMDVIEKLLLMPPTEYKIENNKVKITVPVNIFLRILAGRYIPKVLQNRAYERSAELFDVVDWLTFSPMNDKIYCWPCIFFNKERRDLTICSDKFYRSIKEAKIVLMPFLKRHCINNFHMEAVKMYNKFCLACLDSSASKKNVLRYPSTIF